SGNPVTAAETEIYWTRPDGSTGRNSYRGFDVVDSLIDAATVLSFPLRVTVSEPGFRGYDHSTVIPAGESDYTYSDTVSLQGLRRDLVLDFWVVDQSGIPVEGAEVAVVYTPSEGEETYYATTGGHVATTIEDVTTEQFRCGVAVAKDGYETYENIVTVPAGEAAFTYDTDVVLYYDYSPGITLDPPSPWTYTAHLGTLRNTGNVDLELLSAPEWCPITVDIPGPVAMGE